MKDTTRLTLNYLWQAAHMYACRSPELAAKYGKRFRAVAAGHGIELAQAVKTKMCPRCAALRVPAVSVKLWRPRRRKKVLQCTLCAHRQVVKPLRVARRLRAKAKPDE